MATTLDALLKSIDANSGAEFALRLRRLTEQLAGERLADRLLGTLIRRCVEAGVRHNARLSQYYWQGLLRQVRDPAVLATLADTGEAAFHDALLDAYRQRKQQLGQEQGPQAGTWDELYPLAESQPELVARSRNRSTHFDPELWRRLWASGRPDARGWVADALFDTLGKHRPVAEHGTVAVDLLAQFAGDDPAPLNDRLDRVYVNGYRRLPPPALRQLAERRLFEPLLLPLLAESHRRDPEAAAKLSRELVGADPQRLTALKPTALAELLRYFDPPLLEQSAAVLTTVIGKSAAQALRDALAERFAELDPQLLTRLGWLDKKTKNIRLACTEILVRHPDRAAVPLARTLAAVDGLEQTAKDRLLERLEQFGEDVAALGGGVDLQALNAEAAKLKRVQKSVEQVYDDGLAAALPELQPALVRWLLQQLATAKEQLPRSVRQLLGLCAGDNLLRFNDALLQRWLAADGDPKLRWVLQPLALAADDRLVTPLQQAIHAWHKKRKPRALVAIEALAKIDTVYALSQVKAVAENRRYTDALINTAQAALQAAAKRRRQPLAELYDDLVPDFGLGGEGLALDLGPYAYRVKLQTDLSLRVTGPQGKVTKTLPKAKTGEDPQLRADAEARFKDLRKAIKTVVAQQQQSLQGALFSQRRWPLGRWRRLFVDHPLRRPLAQNLIWSVYPSADAPDPTASLRPAEDLSLIGYDDEPVVPGDDAWLALWHPAVADEAEREAWREHVADYGLKPPLAQTALPVLTLKPEWLDGDRLIAYQGHVVTQAKLRSLMTKWHYRVGPTEDGGYIYGHYLLLPESHLRIDLYHTGMPAWSDFDHPVAIDHLSIYTLGEAGKQIAPARLSSVTLSLLLGQLQTLAEQGSGFRPDWKKL